MVIYWGGFEEGPENESIYAMLSFSIFEIT